MTTLFKKLNYKNQGHIVVLKEPNSFTEEIVEMKKVTTVASSFEKLKEIEFVLLFVTTLGEIKENFKQLFSLCKGDSIIWLCYPKGTSKKYTCNFNRDTLFSSIS